jgi:ACR3 family arsenite transporter
VFRVIVPLVLYFCIMWTGAFALIWWLNRRTGAGGGFGYDLAVVHAFTAGSNNFELAIAVAVAVFGVGSDQALAATIGPLAEVPVLLALTWAALWLRVRLPWAAPAGADAEKAGAADGRAEKAHIAEP